MKNGWRGDDHSSRTNIKIAALKQLYLGTVHMHFLNYIGAVPTNGLRHPMRSPSGNGEQGCKVLALRQYDTTDGLGTLRLCTRNIDISSTYTLFF